MRPVSGTLPAEVARSARSEQAAEGKVCPIHERAEDGGAGISMLHGSNMARKMELRAESAVAPGSAHAMVGTL